MLPLFPTRRYNGYFVDLFVRVSNAVAIAMYKKMGYVVYRQVLNYYSGEEDAYGGSSRECVPMSVLSRACACRIGLHGVLHSLAARCPLQICGKP